VERMTDGSREESASAGFRSPGSDSHLPRDEESLRTREPLVPGDASRPKDGESPLNSAACASGGALESDLTATDRSTRDGRDGLVDLHPLNSSPSHNQTPSSAPLHNITIHIAAACEKPPEDTTRPETRPGIIRAAAALPQDTSTPDRIDGPALHQQQPSPHIAPRDSGH
jgi:hypothetical protein